MVLIVTNRSCRDMLERKTGEYAGTGGSVIGTLWQTKHGDDVGQLHQQQQQQQQDQGQVEQTQQQAQAQVNDNWAELVRIVGGEGGESHVQAEEPVHVHVGDPSRNVQSQAVGGDVSGGGIVEAPMLGMMENNVL
jgi:hypothetical protein